MSVRLYSCLHYPADESRLCTVSHFNLWPLWFYLFFPTLSYKRRNFRKKDTEHKICVLSETFLIL